MGNELVQLLEAEFNELYETSDVIKIETKIRNIRFLSELTKFNVCPSQVVLECCGKYLVKMEDSKLKFNNLLDFLQRLKESNKTLTYPNPLPNYLSIEENINTKAMASLDNAYF
jgi:hypothetical protein